MEISLSQSIESFQMPPKTDRDYSSTSFTGLPSELIDGTRDLADRKDMFMYDVFREAIEDLTDHLDSLPSTQRYDWPLSRPKTGTTPYNARMETDVLESMRSTCERYGVKKNIFFMAALRDHLRKHGIEVEI
jgi:hypothetical protein